MREDRDYHNQGCVNALPLVLLRLPFALVLHGFACWAQRRARAGDRRG